MAEGSWQLVKVELPESSGLSDLQMGVRVQMAAWREHASWHCATLARVYQLHRPFAPLNPLVGTSCIECLKDWPCPTSEAVTGDG